MVIVAGHKVETDNRQLNDEHLKILRLLLKECSIKTAVALTTEITGQRKKLLYQTALEMQGNQGY